MTTRPTRRPQPGAASPQALGGPAAQALRLLTFVAGLALTCLALAAGLAAVTAGRDETRAADAAIILAGAAAEPASLDLAVDLYRRGLTNRLILAGAEPLRLRSALIERGLPEAALTSAEGPDDSVALWAGTARAARGVGAETVLLINDGSRLLRDLKIARDLGLKAYGVPAPGHGPGPGELLRASLDYWAYTLAGR